MRIDELIEVEQLVVLILSNTTPRILDGELYHAMWVLTACPSIYQRNLLVSSACIILISDEFGRDLDETSLICVLD